MRDVDLEYMLALILIPSLITRWRSVNWLTTSVQHPSCDPIHRFIDSSTF